MSAPIQASIESKLAANFQTFQVINESSGHNVPVGSETHFKVVVVDDNLEGVSRIGRHRMVNALLKEELDNGVHALSVVAKTVAEFGDGKITPSPRCRGGDGSLPPKSSA